MDSFVTRHASEVKGTLSGFDRVRFRGTLRWLANLNGMGVWLSHTSVLLKDFKDYAMGLTNRIKEATQELAENAGRPVRYLASSSLRKENVARDIAERDGITEGLVCVLTAVEPCHTFTVGPNRAAKKLELRSHPGKCLHQYFYLIDPQLGWLNVRLQTWFPFTVHIVINGREWLSRELCRKGIDFERRENCFTDLGDVSRAQKAMDRQLRTAWPRLLDRLVRQVHPSHRTLFGKDRLHHYWSADETEWATDVMFRSPRELSALYPRLVQYAMTTFGSGEVLRFLGKRGSVQQFRKAEIISHLGTRPEGIRVKHALDRNSVKMYDKQESVLRIETTINNTRQMKVFRTAENDPEGLESWQKLRKGVADLHRRAEISQKSNERYLEALSAVDAEPTLAETAAEVCRRTRWKKRSVRALNPLADDDARLLEAVSRGEFVLLGFRNRDLRGLLLGKPASADVRRRQTAKVTRMIRMLRAHGLVHKIPKTHRYTVSPKGRETIAALLAARSANTQELMKIAA
ncbi:MAG: hypothetical protein ACC628_23930 [Pirellulaceae bacterium]